MNRVGTPPCDELETELALERIEGELAVELPAHMRAFARAHAGGRASPPAPLVAAKRSTLDVARDACSHDLLVDRGLSLLRLVAPIMIEADPLVAALRARQPTWAGLAELAAARDAASRTLFGKPAIELIHQLHGVSSIRVMDDPGPAIDGWHVPDVAVDTREIDDAWNAIASRAGISGSVRVDRSGKAAPRAFNVEPKVEVIVVVPAVVNNPAARFAVLHELGHAIVALSMRPGVPRVVDEAAAAYVSRLAEPPSWLPPKWPSELAVAARGRRLRIASLLDNIERALPDVDVAAMIETVGPVPTWSLWHDPGAQAAYVEAEDLSERLRSDLGQSPARGQLVRALIAARDRIDQETRL